jgi:methionyl-tRNA synthetase
MREARFGSDFSFGEEKVRLRRNGDLGNDLGNLVKRTLAMLARYRGGRVPEVSRESDLAVRFADLGERVGAQIAVLAFRDALDAVWELVTALNVRIEERKPWELNKRGDEAALDAVLYDLCEGLRWLAHLTFPFMPATGRGIQAQLGLAGEPQGPWAEQLVWGGLPPGTQTAAAEAALFPRLDEPAEAL